MFLIDFNCFDFYLLIGKIDVKGKIVIKSEVVV